MKYLGSSFDYAWRINEKPIDPTAPWVPGCEGNRYFSNVPQCLMPGFPMFQRVSVYVSMLSDDQVSKEYKAQVPAFMVLESRAKNQRVPFHQEGSQDLGGSRVTLKNHQISSQSPGQQKS